MRAEPEGRANVWKSLVIVVLALALAGTTAYFTPDFQWGLLHLKSTNFSSGLVLGTDTAASKANARQEAKVVAAAEDSVNAFVQNAQPTPTDSNRLPGDTTKRATDSIRVLRPVVPLLSMDTAAEDTALAPIIDYGVDSMRFAAFVRKLNRTTGGNGKVRIAYFGDSEIEGDLVTGDLRAMLQQAYGGQGVGLVPITSETAGFRTTIRHTFSSNWREFSAMRRKPGWVRLGLMGHSFAAFADGSEKEYSASYKATKNNPFAAFSLFYRCGRGGGQLKLHYGTTAKEIALPCADATLNTFALPTMEGAKALDFKVIPRDTLQLLAANFDGPTGVYVDNLSLRGNSGLALNNISEKMLGAFQTNLHYDLIVLHYGLNVVGAGAKSFAWYERGMLKVVNRLKVAFPGVPILIVSVSDRSSRQGFGFATDVGVRPLIRAQQHLAQITGTSFWNLYLSMGGYNSMVRMVHAHPPMANQDYTHPNFRGARKFARLIFAALTKGNIVSGYLPAP